MDTPIITSVILSGMMALLYLGPETIMPLASILAAIVGVLLIFWRFIIGFIRRIFRALTGKADPEASLDNEMPISESVSHDHSDQNE